MDFSTSAETAALVDKVRAFVHEACIPLEPQVLRTGFTANEQALAALRAEARVRGLWAPQLPTSLGGLGLSLLDTGLVGEALGESLLGHYAVNFQAPDAGNMELLHMAGTSAQQQRYLGPLVRGEIRSCFGMTEPGRPGSNPVWLETTAHRDGGGDDFIIRGRKWFTTGADGASFCVVMATTQEEGKPHERASMFIVPMDAKGVTLERNLAVMGEAGSGWASHGEVSFDDVRVPSDALLGELGHGFALAQQRLGPGRIHHCMRWLGMCRRAFELLVRRAVERPLMPFRALGHQQVVQHWIAEAAIEIEACRLMVQKVAWTIDHQGHKSARDDVAMIKVKVARTLGDILDKAIQAHGALGLTDDLPLAFWFRHERAARIYDGPDEVHLTSIARRLLSARGLPG